MYRKKEDILSKITILIKDIRSGNIADEQVIAELREIKFLIKKHLD